MRLPLIPWSIAGVPLSQALPGYLITAPPSVCVPAVLSALAVWIQKQKNKKWQLWQPLLQVVPLDTLEYHIQTAICHVDLARRDPASPLPQNMTLAKPLNKEKSYKKQIESRCSDQWQKHLELTLNNPPGRVRAYVHWHLHNKQKRSMYKPAPYLTHQSCPYQLELLRIRTQHTIHYTFPTSLCIPTCLGGLQRQSVPALPCYRHNSTWGRTPHYMPLPSHQGGPRKVH